MTDERFGKSSASRLHIVCACPGFLNLWNSIRGDGNGEPEPAPDADWGNAVHAAWAGNLSELSLNERQQLVKKKADSVEDALRTEIFGGEGTEIATFVETRFVLRDWKRKEIVHSAQIDKAHTDGQGKWLIMDLKSLHGDQDPPDLNWQLLAQACCVADDDDTRNKINELPIKEVTACIVQPLVTLTPQLVRFDFDDLRRAKRLILEQLDKAQAIDAPLIPGPQCKFCPCNRQCVVSAADLMALDKRKSFDVSTLTPEMVVEVIKHLPSLKRRIEEVEQHAKKLASDGLLPGYEMRSQDGNRFIQSQEAVQGVRDALSEYVSRGEILDMISLPIGELRTLAIDRIVQRERMDKVEAGKLVDKLLEAHCRRKNPIKKLAKVKE